jgi:hypothetical protein
LVAPLPILMGLVAPRQVKWAIVDWILGSGQATLDVGVRGTTLSSALNPKETVILPIESPRAVYTRFPG